MASAFAHAAVAIASGHAFFPKPRTAKLWALSIACSILPDADVIGFAFGIPYEHPLGHRGFSHSLVFAAIVSAAVVYGLFRESLQDRPLRRRLLLHFFLVTASHGVLDAMTDGGLGIAFFAPFDSSRYFLPWTPIAVSPIGIREFFTGWGRVVLASEHFIVGPPVAAAIIGAALLRRRGKEDPPGDS